MRIRDDNKLSIQNHIKMYVREKDKFEAILKRAEVLGLSLSAYLKLCVDEELAGTDQDINK